MLLVIIDAALLVVMLQAIGREDIEFGQAFVVALIASLVLWGVGNALGSQLGISGVILACLIVAILTAACLSIIYSIDFKTGILICLAFVTIHMLIGLAFAAFFGLGAQGPQLPQFFGQLEMNMLLANYA